MSQRNRLFADLSSNNSVFNAREYLDAGHIFVAIKATEGTSYVNPNHRGWCLHAGGVHIGIAHYHFARPDLNTLPEAEAQHFLRVAGPLAGGRDYLVVDVERAAPAGWEHDPSWCRAFDSYVQDHSRFHTILYANRSTLQISDAWLVGDKKRVWDADWSSGPDYAPPGYTCAMRQFTDGVFGPQPHGLTGVGSCDVNTLSPRMFAAVSHQLP